MTLDRWIYRWRRGRGIRRGDKSLGFFVFALMVAMYVALCAIVSYLLLAGFIDL